MEHPSSLEAEAATLREVYARLESELAEHTSLLGTTAVTRFSRRIKASDQ